MKRLSTFHPMRPHYFSRIAIVLAALSAFVSPCWAQTFTQQGPKLVGTDAVGGAGQGASVALSGDGNTAILGGPGDNGGVGAAWVFTRSGGVWSQQGTKLVGPGFYVMVWHKAILSHCPVMEIQLFWVGLVTTVV